ncbi:MAG: SDR family NAD(P)-dependent oxidoreductase, partial [Acetobacteraceae bacterium]|nr:SDR family NAD(P)-dependent oxidoreductase [Acetobacteraceae bacterium]
DMTKARHNLAHTNNVEVANLDLADPASVDRFADRVINAHNVIHLLINNAGIMRPSTLMRNIRGHELQFATNHLGHFQLTARLWPAVKNAPGARVVTLSSIGHRYSGVDLDDPDYRSRPYDKAAAYGQSKSANSLFSVELDRRGQGHGVRAFAVHPGGVLTDLVRYLTDDELKAWGITRDGGVLKAPSSGFKSLAQGAATTLWCSLSPQLAGKGGVYCEDCDIAELVPNDSPALSGVRHWAVDQPTAKALWDLSERLTGLKWLDAEPTAAPDPAGIKTIRGK